MAHGYTAATRYRAGIAKSATFSTMARAFIDIYHARDAQNYGMKAIPRTASWPRRMGKKPICSHTRT